MYIQWFVQAVPTCCAAARRSIQCGELNFHVMMPKWTRAVITKLQRVRWKETMGAYLKHFELGCFITEGVCTFDTRYKCREASKASFRTQPQSGPVLLSALFHNSYLGGPLKTNSTTSRPIQRQTNSRRCVKSAVYLLNLKINFFLLSRTFLPVDIANKTTNNYVFS